GQTDQQEAVLGSVAITTDDRDEFAIALQQNFGSTLAAVAKIDLRHPVGTEAGIENSVGSVSRDSKILDSSVLRDSEPSSDNPAIGLKRGRARTIKVLIAEVGVHFSSHAECRIDGAITEITHSGEVIKSGRIIGGADRDNLSVGLDQNRKGIVFQTEKIG